MSLPDQSYTRNLLLSRMKAADYALLQPHLKRVKLGRNEVLVEADTPIEYVHFLEGGVASIVSQDGGEEVEVGLVGSEGLTGAPIFLGADRTPDKCFLQIDNATGLRIDANVLLAAARRSQSLHDLFLRFVHVMNIQAARTAVANASFELPQRLARWLLMCHDRVDGDLLLLTHEFMAMMLAVRRSGVTVTLHTIEGTGAVAARRGAITVLDRAILERLAGDSYGTPESEYRRLIGAFGKSPEAIDA